MIAMRAMRSGARLENYSAKCGRSLREEGRRFGCARPGFGRSKSVPISRRRLEAGRCVQRAGGQRGERIASWRFFEGLAAQVDETAAVGVLQRMHQRCLPAGKQCCGEQKPY
jgi:hypothetical protein